MNVTSGIENLSQILPSANLEPTAAGKAQPGVAETGTSGASDGQIHQTDRATSDKAVLSTVGTQAAQAAQSVSSDSSDVRLDKVASIQAALQAGTYRVPAAAVAQKLIASLVTPEK